MTRFRLRAKEKKKENPETILTRSLRATLDLFRIFHWKQIQGLGSVKGISDIIGIRTVSVDDLVRAGVKKVGIFWAGEVKLPGKNPTPEQQNFLDNVNDAGGIGFVIRCQEDLLRGLDLKVSWIEKK